MRQSFAIYPLQKFLKIKLEKKTKLETLQSKPIFKGKTTFKLNNKEIIKTFLFLDHSFN